MTVFSEIRRFAERSLAVFLLVCSISCTSTPPPEKSVPGTQSQNSPEETAASSYTDESAVKLDVPKRQPRSFFRDIPDNILKSIESGDPASLKTAAASLQKQDKSYTDAEKTLLFVASGIMRIAWPTEKITWDEISDFPANAYSGAVASAEKGVYDSSTGGIDFLTLELPSLVLLTNTVKNDYYADSQTALTLAAALNDNSVLVHYLQGILYQRQNNNAQALEQFKIAAGKSPGCFQTSYAYAHALFRSAQMQPASEIAEQLILSYPSDINLLKLCAETAFALKQYQKAELYAARVLQQNPADSEYILFRARILVEEGDYIKAVSLLDVFARTNATSRDYLMLRSRIQRDWNKNLHGAVETIKQAVLLYPDDTDVLLAAARLASETGETINGKSAGELANLVLAADPESAEALNISIQELIDRRRWNDAYRISLRLIQKNNASAEIQHTHITICLALSKTTEAWELAEALYKKSPNEELVLQSYLEVLYALGRKAEAASLIAKLLPSATSRLKSFLYYRRSFLADNEQAVLSDLRSSLISNPRNEEALYRLYTIYYDKKDYRRAQYYLKQVVAIHPANEDLLKRNAEIESLLQ